MNYAETNAGRARSEASETGSARRFWTFDDVETRLADAMEAWWRVPDRERGWQHVRALWPDIARQGWRVDVDGEFDEREAVQVPRRPALTRDQVKAMVEASEWLAFVPERDRRLVAIVLTYRVRGFDKVPWLRIWDRLGRGRPGPEGLRKRYGRALAGIAAALNG
ncbi:MAG TPA: hypothetical protein VN231_06005 [Allosphingosinicella sp.]|nr:hypothetical protein [Allosphingosinicella sp.]